MATPLEQLLEGVVRQQSRLTHKSHATFEDAQAQMRLALSAWRDGYPYLAGAHYAAALRMYDLAQLLKRMGW